MIPAANGDWSWLWLGWLVAGYGYWQTYRLARSAWHTKPAPWAPLLIASVALVVLWQMRAGTFPGLSLHLMGGMLSTLVLGPGLAVVPLTVALASVMVLAGTDWATFGLNACLLVFWPLWLSQLLARGVGRLPRHLFVFIFIGGFFSSAIVVLLTGWLLTMVLWLMQFYPWGSMLEDFASYWFLVAFSEAWISGMLLTVLVVYRPERVALFDAVRYIDQA